MTEKRKPRFQVWYRFINELYPDTWAWNCSFTKLLDALRHIDLLKQQHGDNIVTEVRVAT